MANLQEQLKEKYQKLKELLISDNPNYKMSDIDRFVNYCTRSEKEIDKKKNNEFKNPHFQRLSAEKLAEAFRSVYDEGLILDGNHITIQSTGLLYDYIARKNKMLLAYPESIIDVQLVYQGDVTKFSKESGKVVYTHEIADPFNSNIDEVVGGYIVIKNKRGEFLTTMTTADFEQHREAANGDFIWKLWTKAMYLKTLFRQGCGVHFQDIFERIDEQDNNHFDLNKLEEKKENPAVIRMRNFLELVVDIEKLKKHKEKAEEYGLSDQYDEAVDRISEKGGSDE